MLKIFSLVGELPLEIRPVHQETNSDLLYKVHNRATAMSFGNFGSSPILRKMQGYFFFFNYFKELVPGLHVHITP